MSDELTESIGTTMPYARTLGIKMISVSTDRVVARLDWRADLCTTGDALHGGSIMGLADACGGILAFQNLPEGAAGTTTVTSATNFLRGVRSGAVTATSRLLHRGRTTIVVDTEVRDGDDRLVARITQTQAVLGPVP